MTIQDASVMQQSGEMADFIQRFYTALGSGDTDAIRGMVSRQSSVLLIGTDPAEWYTDYDTVIRILDTQMKEAGGGFPLKTTNLVAYSQGDVGWGGDQPSMDLPDGSQLGFRLTVVAHREDGGWKMVQGHFSIGVSNEEALGEELTTG